MRRKTLNRTNTSPRERQERLQAATREKLADSWFSLHVDGVQRPIYVSEVIEEAMNPSFRFFDLNCYGAFVTRLDECTVKYWAKAQGVHEYGLLIELRLSFRSLQYIGKTIESFHHPLPHSAILFHLTDGIYTSLTDLPFDQTLPVITPQAKQLHNSEPTSSFDALMRLSNLDDCIQDALSTREKLTGQINKLLDDQKAARDAVQDASQADESLATTNRYLAACRRQVQAARKRRDELQASLAARRAAMKTGAEAEKRSRQQLESAKQDLSSPQQSRQSATKFGLAGQIRRIGEDLSSIYPIDPLTTGSLAFTIRSLHLPKAGAAPPPEKDTAITAAALGHTAHLTYLLSFYLSVALPYPITLHSSTSTIYDPISTTMPSEPARTFPLYQKGAVAYRFEYGVFLLNADIELLMSRQGARMVDLRHTLANLKYILTVITEGKGEVPGRKKGQIKALNGSLSSRESSVSTKGRNMLTGGGVGGGPVEKGLQPGAAKVPDGRGALGTSPLR